MKTANKPRDTPPTKRPQPLVLASLMVFCVAYFNLQSLAPEYMKTSEKATEALTNKVTFPLIIGDPTLKPVEVLERNFVFQKQYCTTYKADRSFACDIEWDEWMLVRAFVQPGDVVIEFGGRFGTTSCLLSQAVGPTGAVVAVEPDELVHGFLLRNRHLHNCGFHALLGTVGLPQYRVGPAISHYGQQTTTVKPNDGAAAFPNMVLSEIERSIGRKVNVALIDCEGCIGSVHDAGVLDQVDVILMEEDGFKGNQTQAYSEWHATLVRKGFSCKWYLQDTTAPRKAWSRNLRHSAWIREGSKRDHVPCKEYAAKTGQPGAIICRDLPSLVQ